MTEQSVSPMLLLMAPDEHHVCELYLEEVLLTEGYNAYDKRVGGVNLTAGELARYPLVIIASGAAAAMDKETVAQYMAEGGRVIALRPPRDWSQLFGLGLPGETYAVIRDAYIRVNAQHPWLAPFPALDLQCPGENDVYPNVDAETLAWTAGQAGEASGFPAVALKRVGEGAGVVFTYDLAQCIVLFHQGRLQNASNGPDPDANRDGKFTPDDLLEGMRDYTLRHVPQADVHQDLLVRVIRGLTEDRLPVPRLWHFPHAAPAMLFVNGDGDGMTWDDLSWTVDTCEQYGAKFTFYLMDEQIAAFSREGVAEMVARGHAFGPHPWVSLRPTVEQWRQCISGIVGRFRQKFGFQPRSLRSHCVVFVGYDESPRCFLENGLRLDTNFINGYRFQSGYANGSALPVKFVDRAGRVLDVYEQATIHGDDVMCSPKTMLPARSPGEALQMSLQAMRDLASTYHGVYQPYFHPIYLGGRSGIRTREWFMEVLGTARQMGLPSVNAEEWLAFNDARRSVSVTDVTWEGPGGRLSFVLHAERSVAGLTVLLPVWRGQRPVWATATGEPARRQKVPYEGGAWTGVEVTLRAGEPRRIEVGYGAAEA